jgi:hypothetical protein
VGSSEAGVRKRPKIKKSLTQRTRTNAARIICRAKSGWNALAFALCDLVLGFSL